MATSPFQVSIIAPSSPDRSFELEVESAFPSSLEIIHPLDHLRNSEDHLVTSFFSSMSQMEELAKPLLEEESAYISMEETEEVEIDAEEWTAHTYQTNHGRSTYYTVQVPITCRYELIAQSRLTDDVFINVPGSSDHCWPILTSKKHRVEVIPPDFEEWMDLIHRFLRKSAEYFRPYKSYVIWRVFWHSMCCCLPILLSLLFGFHELCKVKYDFILLEVVGTVLVVLVGFFLSIFIAKRRLANGVEALKKCWKDNRSVLPPNIKVVLGPYGAYWKFVLRS